LRKILKMIVNRSSETVDEDDLSDIKDKSENWRKNKKKRKYLEELLAYFSYFLNVITEYLKKNSDVTFKMAAISAAVLLYIINPNDLIPDYLPTLGYLDDLAVVGIFFPLIKYEFD